MVIWLTGLSGSGKTSIGRQLCDLWKAEAPNTVLVDGDDIRRLLGLQGGEKHYTLDGRREIAGRISDLCAWLDRQGLNVVCCTISLFADLHQHNRDVFSRYFEVYIDVPMDVLYRRDDKNLYARALRGEIQNVIGVDLPFTPPASPDLVVDNSRDGADPRAMAAHILEQAKAFCISPHLA